MALSPWARALGPQSPLRPRGSCLDRWGRAVRFGKRFGRVCGAGGDASGSPKPLRTSASPPFPFAALEQLLSPGRGVPHSGILATGEFLKCQESQNPQQVSESSSRPEGSPCSLRAHVAGAET